MAFSPKRASDSLRQMATTGSPVGARPGRCVVTTGPVFSYPAGDALQAPKRPPPGFRMAAATARSRDSVPVLSPPPGIPQFAIRARLTGPMRVPLRFI